MNLGGTIISTKINCCLCREREVIVQFVELRHRLIAIFSMNRIFLRLCLKTACLSRNTPLHKSERTPRFQWWKKGKRTARANRPWWWMISQYSCNYHAQSNWKAMFHHTRRGYVLIRTQGRLPSGDPTPARGLFQRMTFNNCKYCCFKQFVSVLGTKSQPR